MTTNDKKKRKQPLALVDYNFHLYHGINLLDSLIWHGLVARLIYTNHLRNKRDENHPKYNNFVDSTGYGYVVWKNEAIYTCFSDYFTISKTINKGANKGKKRTDTQIIRAKQEILAQSKKRLKAKGLLDTIQGTGYTKYYPAIPNDSFYWITWTFNVTDKWEYNNRLEVIEPRHDEDTGELLDSLQLNELLELGGFDLYDE